MPSTPDYVAQGVWKTLFISMCLIPFVSIPFDFAYGAANGLGRTANLALIFSLLFVLTISRFLDYVRQPGERAFLFFAVAFVGYSLFGASANNVPVILTFPGLFALYSCFAIGISTYAMEKTDSQILAWTHKWLMVGLLPVIALPLLVTATADAFTSREWMSNLYGFSNVRALGDYVVVAILASAGYLGIASSSPASRAKTATIFVYLTAMWAVLFWSGSRACLLAACVAIGFANLVMWRAHLKHLALNVAAIVTGGALSTLLFLPHHSYGILARFGNTAKTLSENVESLDDAGAGVGASVNALATGRLDIWDWAVQRILERPLLGWGYLPMKEMGDGTPPFAHAHNLVLEYALGFGIPVALLLLGVAAYFWWRGVMVAARNPSPARLSALYLVTGLPIASLLSVTMLSPFQLMVFGMCLGALLGIDVRERRAQRLSDRDISTEPADTVFL